MATAAVSVRKYVPFFRQQGVGAVLDYGAGTLRNSCYMAREGFRVYAADLPEQVERILAMAGRNQLAGVLSTGELERSELAVDLVLSSYVLNIIPDGSAKTRYLANIALNLRQGGFLLVEVRCRGASTHCSSACSVSHKCSNCIKTYSHAELDELFLPHGFRRVSHYYRRHAVAVLYQRLC